jgi:regulatory protein
MSTNYQQLISNQALKLITIRFRTEKEIRNKLQNKYPNYQVIIDQVINLLKTYNLINDQRFCENYITHRLHTAPQGKMKIIKELIQKGIDYQTAVAQTQKLITDEEIYTLILAQKKIKSLNPLLSSQQKKQKLFFFLNNKGFDSNCINKTINKVINS